MSLIWITRSEPGASELAGLLEAAGVAVLCHPVVQIERFEQWRASGAIDGDAVPAAVVVLSVHAAEAYTGSDLAQRARNVPHFAVGKGTARKLAESGMEAAVPDQASSEGLLELPAIEALPAGAEVWLMAGEGGRDLLETTLGGRGIRTVKVDWYRRRTATEGPARLAEVTLIEVSSATALEAVAQRLVGVRDTRSAGLVVASGRLEARALELGFHNVHNARAAAPAPLAAAMTMLAARARGDEPRT